MAAVGAVQRRFLIRHDVPEEMIEQVTVGVDPSGGGDEIGIVVSALLVDHRLAVLADRSTGGSPAQGGEAAVKAHDDFDADDIVVETNFGGDMCREVITQAAGRLHERGERESPYVRKGSIGLARQGDAGRACEPVI
jgi:phage terminase large subunit-like protein